MLLGERDPHGRPIPGGVQKSFDPVDGHDIVLTIDKDIQYQAQTELAAAVKKWGAKSGSVVIMNPRNGEIYAMASTPGFNPNDYGKADAEGFRNRPISDAYEPGSTIKSPDGGGGHRQGPLHARVASSTCRPRSRSAAGRSTSRTAAAPSTGRSPRS